MKQSYNVKKKKKKKLQEPGNESILHPLGFHSLNAEVSPRDIFSVVREEKYFAEWFLVIKK